MNARHDSRVLVTETAVVVAGTETQVGSGGVETGVEDALRGARGRSGGVAVNSTPEEG